MIVEDQSEVVAFLSDSASHGAATRPIVRVETHGAIVFLAAAKAYKLKRAVRFDYMDAGRPREAVLSGARRALSGYPPRAAAW